MELSNNLDKIPLLYEEFVKQLKLKIARADFGDVITPSSDTDSQLKVEIEADFVSFIQDFFRLCNLAVLEGDYCGINNIDALKRKLEEDVEYFTGETKDLFTINFEGDYLIAREVCDVIENAINRFIELAVRLDQKISNSKKTFLSLTSLDQKDERSFWHYEEENETLFSVLHYNSTLYALNVSASILDFSLEYVDFERIIQTLQSGILWIEGIKSTHVVLSDAVTAKCGFLCFKIMSRIKVEDPNTTFIIDSNPYNINIIEAFSEWSKHINRHYELNGTEKAKEEIKTVKDTLGTDYSNLNLSDLHLLIKFYKDCSTYLHSEVFNELSNAVEKKYHDLVATRNGNKFDEFAHKFALNYVLNNQLSDIIHKSNGDDNAIHFLYSRICKIQEETNVDNFFPHSRYLDYLLNKIASLINERNIFEIIDQIEPLLKRAKNVFDRYDRNVYWSQRKYNYIFYLSSEECFVDYNDKDLGPIKIFIASSFTLPLRKEKYIQDFEENKKRLVNIERSLEVLQIVAKEHNELKDKSERLAREVKTKEIKYIEILSIFAAIIVFAAGSFTTLLNVARGIRFGELSSIILSIGLILFLFVGLVFFISQVPFSKLWEQVKKNKQQKWIIPLLVLVPLLGTIGVGIYYTGHHINQDYKEMLMKQKEILSKQDSIIQIQNLNIIKQDSIISQQILLPNKSAPANEKKQRLTPMSD